jgi:hypothetical protein
MVAWGSLQPMHRARAMTAIPVAVAMTIFAARMLAYFGAIVLRGGCGLYEQDGRIIHLFPFYGSIRLEEITAVTLGDDYFVVGWPRYIVIRGWGDQKIFVHSFYYRTSFREIAARLAALGLPVAGDPRLKVDPFAPEPKVSPPSE